MAGLISDYTNGRATTCCIMLILAAPMVCMTSRAKCMCLCVCGPLSLGIYTHTCLFACVYLSVHSLGRRSQG